MNFTILKFSKENDKMDLVEFFEIHREVYATIDNYKFKFMKKKILHLVILCLPLLGIAQQGQAYKWGNVAIGGGGFVSAVIASPIEKNILYARTDVGGAYRWNEAGQEWVCLTDWMSVEERGLMGIEAIAVDPRIKGVLYMMAGTSYWNAASDGIGKSAFLRSKDYGATWEKIYVWDDNVKYFNVHGNGMGRGNGEALAVDPVNSDIMFYGSKNRGLWKSGDNGNTWQKVERFPVDTTWNGSGMSFVAFDSSSSGQRATSRMYVGVLRDKNNVFVSNDAGSTWELLPNMPTPTYDGSASMRLMPQRIAIVPGGSAVYITFANGAGPHTMQWDEGWGDINDWFNRGAVYMYDVAGQTWTDVSPQNLLNPSGDGDYTDPAEYYGGYSGIAINPANPNHIVVSSIASYRGTQYWKIDGEWKDRWGDNIFISTDGGISWAPSFSYYWIEGGNSPVAEQLDENGFPWMVGGSIHWIGSVCIDPFNPKRVFVTSGNGVFMTENVYDYEKYKEQWEPDSSVIQRTVWKFASQGIEETVPLDIVSVENGFTVSVIGDYDGFVHENVAVPSQYGSLATEVSGDMVSLGTTTGIACASKTGRLVKCANTRTAFAQNNDVPIGPVQYSDDNGITWTTETYTDSPPANLKGGKVALSADGEVALWMPQQTATMYRHYNSQWTAVQGIAFEGRPVADYEDASVFYVFNKWEGSVYVSTNAGLSFAKAGFAGKSNFGNIRAVPGHAGHLWVPIALVDANGNTSGGIAYSVDGGNTFNQIDGVGYCEAVGFGKAKEGSDYPALFVYAQIGNVLGVWHSDDRGKTWMRVSDEAHEYGGLANGEFVVGDLNVYGRVYMSTAGRGLVYADVASGCQSVDIASVSASLCDSATMVLATGITDNAYSFAWEKDGMAVDQTSAHIEIAQEGVYTVVATKENCPPSTATFNIYVCRQIIALRKGWNLISLAIEPDDASPASVFPNARCIKNDSLFYIDTLPLFLNILRQLEQGAAYMVFNTIDEEIVLIGQKAENETLHYSKGWNMVAYPLQTDMPVASFVESNAFVLRIKDFDDFWEKDNAKNTLSTFMQGKGYFMYLDSRNVVSW